ncbi:MAG: ABC transporter ATP-binding protein [Alphaproteobacteria bacterium]
MSTTAPNDRSAGPVAREQASAAAKIEIDQVTKRYDLANMDGPPVLDRIDLNIHSNEFVTLVGRSGCGKTTLLNIVAGLIEPTQGEVRVNGRPVTGPGQGKGMVFQQHALFPWLTAIQNVEFGCKSGGMPADERRTVALQLIELVGLRGFEDKYPAELSGGMQQRVAIARALALDPDILLMDEPFGALDELTRIEMQDELLRVWSARKKTVVFVTHSIPEALVLSDRVILMAASPGRIQNEFPVEMPRPRQRTDPEVIALYDEIWRGLH